MLKPIREFLKLEASSGIILIVCAGVALLLANSPLSSFYQALLETPGRISIGDAEIAKPVLLWINDGLMAVFFLLIGLEVKREILDGELANRSQMILPSVAALGGVLVPALIYVAINWKDSVALSGWAIPAATDIAFALGVLYLLGDRIPAALRLLLMTLAIFDDLAAIVIIAIFYSSDLSVLALVLAVLALVVLFTMNRLGITQLMPYMIVGLLLWVFVLKSGVHATLAGVLLAFTIPIHPRSEGESSPLRHLEHKLHPWVAFGILPLFSLANAGVSLQNVSLTTLLENVSLGILLGLFIGKQVGIFSFTWITIRLGWVKRPDNVSWLELWGMAALGGIGFTMSLFIGTLAFEHTGMDYVGLERIGILTGSMLSAVWGYILLRLAIARKTSG